MDWVSVNDCLPDFNQRVVATDGCQRWLDMRIKIGAYELGLGISGRKATHWHPVLDDLPTAATLAGDRP